MVFSRTVLCRGLRFLRCVQCPKMLNLSYQKQHSETFLYFFILGGSLTVKNYPEYKKRFENFSNQKFQIRARIGTRKLVVEVVSSQVVLSDTVYRTLSAWILLTKNSLTKWSLFLMSQAVLSQISTHRICCTLKYLKGQKS